MILFVLIWFAFIFVIYKNSFFGLFQLNQISKKTVAVLFFLKGLGVVAFYVLYQYYYGDILSFDSGVFFTESKTLNNIAYDNFGAYLKTILGLQDNYNDNYIYEHLIKPTRNWQDGRIEKYFFNDNRTVIRVNSILHFISFNNYLILALYNCFIGFIGSIFIYKGFEFLILKHKKHFLFFICLLPSIWLHSAAVLKEPLVLGVIGISIYLLHLILIQRINKSIYYIFFILLLILSFYLKPFITLPIILFTAIAFWLQSKPSFKFKQLFFISIFLLGLFTLNFSFIIFKNKSCYNILLDKQKTFLDAATGGIFLLDSTKFVRLNYDTTLVNKVQNKFNVYTIKNNVPYIFWEHTHQKDTLFCSSNSDTASQYSLVYMVPKSKSNISYPTKTWQMLLYSIYLPIAYPLFINAKGFFMYIVSLENLIVILMLLVATIALFKVKFNSSLLIYLSLIFFLLFVIGITTGNLGAINRYRCLLLPFISFVFFYSISLLKSNK
ncbi:MAG: hypothetical protein LCH32_10380 [Bacteroidetes bacterium]|nr:hypothetical protein [Bacteroidota bacterium]